MSSGLIIKDVTKKDDSDEDEEKEENLLLSGGRRGKRGMKKTHRRLSRGRGAATRGWKNQKPGKHQRTLMKKHCGSKCFLGPRGSFPICRKNTCKVSRQGVYAAYIRGRQYSRRGAKYRRVASRANKLLKKMGVKRS